MKRDYFIGLESHNNVYSLSLAEVIDHIYFDEYGLIPMITQDSGKKDINIYHQIDVYESKQSKVGGVI